MVGYLPECKGFLLYGDVALRSEMRRGFRKLSELGWNGR